MSTSWLIILALILFILLAALLAVTYLKLRKQKLLILLQSKEIEKQIRELIHQNQLQEELNREKKQLILLVSHDLKGPFNRIFALTQLLEMTASNFTEEQKELIGKMHQIVGDGLNMVRNLVDVRKIDERGLEPSPEKINLPTAVLALVKQYRVLAEKKKIKIDFQSPEKLELSTDKNYLSRVLENLLSNAIKFSPPDKSVFVSLKKNLEFVDIAIKDQGPGISIEDQSNLYQKFKKLSARPTGGESSTGLGLSIVKQLVTSMKGEVHCESVILQGSTFTVSLPLHGQ